MDLQLSKGEVTMGVIIFFLSVVSVAFFIRAKAHYKKSSDEQFIRNLKFSNRQKTPKEITRETRIRAERVGAKKFIWRSAGDTGCCSECAKNNGKKFSWKRPPKTGLPGEGKCCVNGICRCWAEVIVPPPPKR